MKQSSGYGMLLRRMHRCLVTVAAVTVLCTAFAGEAMASCFSTDSGPRRFVLAPALQFGAANGVIANSFSSGDNESVVGLWNVDFLVGSGPDIFYQGFQQWHLGGTEVMVDNGVAPSFGNVCVGVWKQTGGRTYKLRHVTFNWDENGHVTGTFQLVMSVKLDRPGNTYTGTYATDSFDLSGNVIPALHAEGRLRGRRITVE